MTTSYAVPESFSSIRAALRAAPDRNATTDAELCGPAHHSPTPTVTPRSTQYGGGGGGMGVGPAGSSGPVQQQLEARLAMEWATLRELRGFAVGTSARGPWGSAALGGVASCASCLGYTPGTCSFLGIVFLRNTTLTF